MTRQNDKPKKGISKNLLFIFFLLINVAIVAWIAVREFGNGTNRAESISLQNMKFGYLLAAILCFAVAVLAETLKYNAMLRASGGRSDLRGAFQCAILGKYYDNVTPLGAGGQPFQIIYLKKRGYDAGTSAALPIAGFLTLQIAFVLIASVVFLFSGRIADELAPIRISAYIGLAFYLFVPACIILFTVMPKTFTGMVRGIMRFLGRLHILKDYEKSSERLIKSIAEYRESLLLIERIPFMLLKLFFFSLIYQAAILSIPYFVISAFGSVQSWGTVFSLVVMIYCAITIAPTPGNGGAAEGSFYAVFASLNTGCLFWAMLIWRLLVYYDWLVLGLILLISSAVGGRREKKRVPSGPLHVAQFCDIYYPAVDGVVRTVDAYAQRLNREGGCCVIAPGPQASYEKELGYPVLRSRSLKLPGFDDRIPLPFFPRRIRKYLKAGTFDVFHAHSPFFVGGFALRMGRRLGVPVVASFHSKYYDDVLNITHSRLLAKIITAHVVRFYERADVVWACSAGTAATLRSYGYHGEIQVMDNGVDKVSLADPEALKRRAEQSCHLPQNRRILLFVGQLIWQKNLRLILDVSRRLKDAGENYTTVLAGTGYDGAAIRKYAEDQGLSDCVSFVGRIDDRELLYGLFLSADLFFFPSVYDNAPLVVREAALMRLPALLTEGTNSAEQIQDGVNGFTAAGNVEAMTNKLRWIFESADLKQVGQRAMESIPVSWDEIAERVLREYHRISAPDAQAAEEDEAETESASA